jgi:[ribosomal protein S5]-alanine N-acetyltransferase
VKFKNLHGKRINLIKLNQNVLSDLHEYSTNPLVYQYLEFPPLTNITETKEYLLKLINRSKSGNAQYWSIDSIKHKKVIGTIGVHDIDWRKRVGDLGFGLSPDYWGLGYINESFNLLFKFLFSDLNFHKIYSTTRTDNIRSIRAMEKEGILRDFYLSHDGKRFNASILSTLRYEYNK